MADYNSSTPGDTEEYKFHEESNVNESAEYGNQPVTSTANAAATSNAKRLFIPIVLVVLIIVVYQVLSWYSNRKAQDGYKQEETVAQKNVQNIIPAPALPQTVNNSALQGIEKKQIDSENATDSDITVQQKLDILAQRAESNTEKVEKINDAVKQNQIGLVNLNHTVNTLDNTVQKLDNSMQQLVAAKTKPVKKVKKVTAPTFIYHVKAIVPGLAWLESSDGNTVAVRIGQELPGYGAIKLISPKDGMVITTSGSVIQYGVNDF